VPGFLSVTKVKQHGARRCRWDVNPPLSVQGLRPESSEMDGELRDADEQQTGQYTL
jgi:hypothetical protein